MVEKVKKMSTLKKLIDFCFLIMLEYKCYLMEKYPSSVEGTGLENREVGNGAGVRIPLSPPFKFLYRGMEQFGSSPGS